MNDLIKISMRQTDVIYVLRLLARIVFKIRSCDTAIQSVKFRFAYYKLVALVHLNLYQGNKYFVWIVEFKGDTVFDSDFVTSSIHMFFYPYRVPNFDSDFVTSSIHMSSQISILTL